MKILVCKLQRSNRYEEDLVGVLPPRPPVGSRLTRKQRSAPEGDRSRSSESVSQNLLYPFRCKDSSVVQLNVGDSGKLFQSETPTGTLK